MKKETLPMMLKIGYGAGTFGPDLFFIVSSMVILYYLTDVVGLSAGLAGVALMVGRIWDAVNDPLIGILSDRTATKMGRRRPYMLAGGIFFSISIVLMFTNPSLILGPELSQAAIFIYVMIAYAILSTAYSVVFIPYIALAPQLTTDYHERSSLNGYRFVFSVLATLMGAGLALPLVNLFQDKNIGFVMMGVAFGVAGLVSALTTVLLVKEKSTAKPAGSVGFWKSYLSAFKNKPYIIILVVYILNMLGHTLTSAVAVYYFKYILGAENLMPVGMSLMLVTALLFIPVSVVSSKKIGKKTPYAVGFLIMAFALMLLFSFGHLLGLNFCLVMLFVMGIGLGFTYIGPYTIVADAIEYDFLISGERKEGVFFGIWTFGAKVCQALGIFLMGITLEFMGYVPDLMPQTESGSLGIRLFLGPVNAFLFVAAAVVLYFYPITQKRYEKILEQIAVKEKELSIS